MHEDLTKRKVWSVSHYNMHLLIKRCKLWQNRPKLESAVKEIVISAAKRKCNKRKCWKEKCIGWPKEMGLFNLNFAIYSFIIGYQD